MRCCLCLRLTFGLRLPAAAQDEKDESREPKGKVRLTLETGGHTSLIARVLFTPDSSQIVTVAHDQPVRVWDVETGECVNVLYPPLRMHVATARLSPDGSRLMDGLPRRDRQGQDDLLGPADPRCPRAASSGC